MKNGWNMRLRMASVLTLLAVVTVVGTLYSATTYNVTGKVTQNGAGFPNVLVTLQNPSSGNTAYKLRTAVDGSYGFLGLNSTTSYRVVPGMTGYGFTRAGCPDVNAQATVANLTATKVPIPSGSYFVKMPLPAKIGSTSIAWKVSTAAGGYNLYNGGDVDIYHSGLCGGDTFYAVDLLPNGNGGTATTLVLAAADGIVTTAVNNAAGSDPCNTQKLLTTPDNYVKLAHVDANGVKNGFQSTSRHMCAGTIQVGPGTFVKQGTVLGRMGSTGYSTGIHSHTDWSYSSDGGTTYQSVWSMPQLQGIRIESRAIVQFDPASTSGYASSNNGLPFGNLDSPAASATVSGTVNINGWALDDGGIGYVDMFVDGTSVGHGAYGSSAAGTRTDVCVVYPQMPGCPYVGFGLALDTTRFSNGNHLLSVAATDNVGASRTIVSNRSISVSNSTSTTVAAAITSPTPRTTLPGPSATFQWTAGTSITQCFVYLGSSLGANDIYGQSQGTNRSVTVSGIPTDGRTIYVRLWSYTGSTWLYRDYSYTTATSLAAAAMASPVPGSKLASSSVSFQWTAGTSITQYFVYVGSSLGANDIYGQSQGSNRSVTVRGLPTDRRTLYVRLWSYTGTTWLYRDCTYTAV